MWQNSTMVCLKYKIHVSLDYWISCSFIYHRYMKLTHAHLTLLDIAYPLHWMHKCHFSNYVLNIDSYFRYFSAYSHQSLICYKFQQAKTTAYKLCGAGAECECCRTVFCEIGELRAPIVFTFLGRCSRQCQQRFFRSCSAQTRIVKRCRWRSNCSNGSAQKS